MRRSLFALCLLAACTRSSDPRLYTLVAETSQASYPTAAIIEVRRPSIAGYLDRREIVLRVESEQLEIASGSNWAEPLDAMIGRVLAADLALRLPKSRVITDLNALGVVPDTRVDVEIQRFEQGQDGLVLLAMVALRRGAATAPLSLDRVELDGRVARGGTQAVVAAMNALLGKLADRVASTLAAALAQPPASAP